MTTFITVTKKPSKQLVALNMDNVCALVAEEEGTLVYIRDTPLIKVEENLQYFSDQLAALAEKRKQDASRDPA